ncbi:MAG: hypothetical protein FJW34_26000, partial [Acidobacteria bacterium]|nr:hypothetical protein [Acidobacteriota bacterium]
MNALDELNEYLGRVERRIRRLAWCRGATAVAVSSLVATVVLVWLINRFAFSDGSALAARAALFFAVALAAGFGLIVPVLMITRARAARAAEKRFPEFEQRLLTVAERSAREPENPFLELLAADAQPVAEAAQPASVVTGRRMAAFASLAAAALGVLLWLIVAGPGYLGYGAALLWAGPSRVQVQPYYEIRVTPGNRTLRRGAGQIITAQLVGFQAQRVRLLARYRNAAKWEEALMQPQAAGSAYEFLFAGLPETVDYYVEAGVLRTSTFTLQVIDLPAVKRIRVTYRFPAWTGLPETVEDPGGDLRAVEGTQAEIAVQTDRPLATGTVVLDDGTHIPLQGGAGNLTAARLTMLKDGLYHLAARERDETVRLTEDYFIDVQKESAPAVRLMRPGRDARVSPIEEVTLVAAAEDDFGLQELTLHYAVNGGPEEKIPVPVATGQRQAEGSAVLYLEDFELVPGDLVSVYATARDARTSARTDMFFLEAQPFEREYSQSQQMGGGGGGEAGASQNRISQRQKEIIAATWNQLRGKSERATAAENAKFLADMQSKLRDQARSLATRVVRRELAGTNQEFQSFSENMTRAAEAMGEAAEKLKTAAWREALPPEQKALQHLLRAESLFRQIQIAFGRSGSGGGGGGGGMGRDLENLFDLELDTEKNQYEAGQRAQSA